MFKFFYWLVLLVSIGSLQPARAEKIPLVTEPVAISPGKSHEFGFGTVPQAGTTVLLKIRSRINSQTLAGSWMVMNVELNGHEVQAQKTRSSNRLVNKPLISPVVPDGSDTWYLTKQGWRTLYAPDFTSALSQTFYVDDPYTLVLDVTDLTNPVAENRLKITNTAAPAIQEHSGADAAIIVGELEIETRPVPSPLMSISGIKTILNRGEPTVQAAPYQGKLLPGGGFAVQAGKNSYNFSSAFSYPNAGFNRLSAGAKDATGQKNWQVSADAKAGRVVAVGSDYRIVRNLRFGKTHVEVADTITNLRQNVPLGMSVRHEMDLTGLKKPVVRIAGDAMQNDYYAAGNPSVHVTVPSGGVGIIAEDNVLRNQALMYTLETQGAEPALAGIRTDMFHLAPGASHTLRWSVYPIATPDYYDFINLVRQDWKANFTVPGGVAWASTPDWYLDIPLAGIRKTLQLNGIRYVMLTGSWVDHKRNSKVVGFGTAVFEEPFEDYRRRIIEGTRRIHEALPGTKVLGYYDVQRDSSENSPQKFADSQIAGADGKPLSTDWGGTANVSYNMVPTLENSFGKAVLADAKRYMDELGLDGIYWDEMDGVAFNSPYLAYNMRDGNTAILDHNTWTIKQEIGLATVISLPFRLAVIREIQKKGGVLLGNGTFATSEELQTGILRMVESQHNDSFAYQGDLQTPFGFIASDSGWKDFLRAFKLAKIPISFIPAVEGSWVGKYPHDVMAYIFPFTPIELHEGYLMGQERIIVTHSGNFGWHKDKTLSLTRHFDGNGKLTGKRFPININAREARTDVRLGENEAAILEKLPLRFDPAAKLTASVKNSIITIQKHDATGIEMEVTAPAGGVLTARNGTFPLRNGQQVSVQLKGAKTTPVPIKVLVKNQALSLNIPTGFSGTCVITPLK